MNLVIDFILVTSIIGILLILFLLLRRKEINLSQKILAALFVLLFFVTLGFYAFLHHLRPIYYVSFLFYFTVGYIAGPLFYIYIKSLFQPTQDLFRKNWKHFIPAVLILLVWNIPLLLSNFKGEFIFSYLDILAENDFDTIELALQIIFFIFYCLLSLRLLKQYQATLKQNYSNLIDKDLLWVKYLIIGSLVAMSLNGVLTILQLNFGVTSWNADSLTTIPLAIMVVYLGYYGLLQSRILLPEFIEKDNQPIPEIALKTKEPRIKHHLTNVPEIEIAELKKRLMEVLANEKPYLNEELTLGMLADFIPTSDKKLSALLNHYIKATFYDFINSYRVAEVKAKIADEAYAHYTLLAIGLDSGFKSKSSFNRIFKKETNLSPSQYKNSLSKK